MNLIATPVMANTAPTAPAATRERGGFVWRAIAGFCITGSGLWAFLPLAPAQEGVPVIAHDAGAARRLGPPALDLAAFNAPLWVAPPLPKVVASVPQTPALHPLKWQLLAIMRDGSTCKALVYDPESDKLLVLGEGDESGQRRVACINSTTIDVRDSAGIRTLALRDQTGIRP